MKKEYDLVLLAVLKNRTPQDENKLSEILDTEIQWDIVIGQLLHHRLVGYFLSGLNEEQKNKIFKETRIALELLVEAQKKQTLETLELVNPILEVLDKEGIKYAGLKGLVFNAGLYSPGDRRSNDTDLLILEEDLDKLDSVLRENNYIQTLMSNGEYKEATRKEKLIQRMNYHDLVPYVKLFDKEFVSEHEFDINFHFDSKDNNITKEVLEYGLEVYENEYYKIKGLPWETNLAHLCVHFYREGTNSIWTSEKRDVVLYKLVDIINLIRSNKSEEKMKMWPELMIKLNLQKAGYYTMHVLSQFYNDKTIEYFKTELKPEDISYITEITVEGANKVELRKELFYEKAFNLSF